MWLYAYSTGITLHSSGGRNCSWWVVWVGFSAMPLLPTKCQSMRCASFSLSSGKISLVVSVSNSFTFIGKILHLSCSHCFLYSFSSSSFFFLLAALVPSAGGSPKEETSTSFSFTGTLVTVTFPLSLLGALLLFPLPFPFFVSGYFDTFTDFSPCSSHFPFAVSWPPAYFLRMRIRCRLLGDNLNFPATNLFVSGCTWSA